ncbi:pfs domain-containing protein, partial [Aureobasidium melanogenum]
MMNSFYPLFVTANVSLQVINRVLQSALDEEFPPGEHWGNDWVLVEQRVHRNLSVPTMPPVQPFESGFLNTSIHNLQNFVTIELIEGTDQLPFPFGIIDERTALDNTISFWAQDDVNPIQEAQIRTMWGGGTPLDRILATYIDPYEYLSYHNPTDNMTKEQSRAHLLAWEDTERDRLALQFYEFADSSRVFERASEELNQTTKWFDFRLDASCAMGHIYLIGDYGPVEIMADFVFKSDMFDANGKLHFPAPSSYLETRSPFNLISRLVDLRNTRPGATNMSTTQGNGRANFDQIESGNIHTVTQYTIGWICALPIELAAAVKMLDEEHPRLPQDPKDDNSYRFGRIGNHNIVIGCLPHGRFGLVSAASVALQMKNSFDNLRIGLMVGIGGGVPSPETDIRLGDIVVSSPTGQHGGVVQYDLGKTRANGEVERTGSLNSPPNALLHVVTEMIAAQELGELQIVTHLSKLADELSAYAFPSKLIDCLYQPHHTHKSGQGCLGCGGSENQVLREERANNDPVIHYGTIASGNQVMKDAVTRDKLSHELGGVLCYEMEAAGLMNNFPCLVIRGISDYSDTHKNDGWRRYAAAVAAAYAKDLLGHLASAKVAQTETLDQLMGDLSQGMARNQTLIEEVGSRLDSTY